MNLLTSDNRQMQRTLTLCAGVASTPTTILLCGESGTGKEVIARHIHEMSDRCNGPFVAINCAAIPESLIESEVFGHEKGAFSGAGDQKKGRFELANGGTLLLDEISELPLNLQAKLLRVLQERQFCRLGGVHTIQCDVRVIATSNRNLAEMVRNGEFREDLYYRINVFPIALPSLRDRKEDIPQLCDVILGRLCDRMDRDEITISEDALEFMMQYAFPGNVRELHNMLERALILTHSNTITIDTLVPQCSPEVRLVSAEPDLSSFSGMTLADIERQVILATLAKEKGNRTRTSEVLGISIRTLRNRIREYRGAGFDVTDRYLGCAA